MTRILLADDHDVVRSGLRSTLEAHPDWEIVADAANGKEAINKALETKPDVAVIDYSLPLLNGIEATRKIRKREPHTEVLIFTMHDAEILIRSALEAGALGYLLKADAKRYVVAAVEALAEHKPFFTAQVPRTLLASFLGKGGTTSNHVLSPREESVIKIIADGRGTRRLANKSAEVLPTLIRSRGII